MGEVSIIPVVLSCSPPDLGHPPIKEVPRMSFFEARGAHSGVQIAVTHDYLVGIGPMVIGICIVALLIVAVWFGRRRSAREPRPTLDSKPRSGAWSTRQEHESGGATADHGPGHQGEGPRTHESREPRPDEMPRDGRRRMPYEVRDAGVRGGKERTRPRRHSGPNVD
jgi:hypothetical protein